MSHMTSQQKLMKVKKELHRITHDYENMEKRVNEKTNELIQNNRLLQAEVAECKRIESEILEITQAEQRRYGSQLHDGLCQELAAIMIFTKSLSMKMEKNNSLELAELRKISDMLLSAVDQARNTARGLYPGELEGASLIHSLVELTSLVTSVSCSFYCPEPIFIDDNIAIHFYRIAQEGISNALKHGRAQNIEVSLTRNDGNTVLTIKDDGIGMTEDSKKLKGIGLKIMKYRAYMMKASFQIEQNLPHGVILICSAKESEI